MAVAFSVQQGATAQNDTFNILHLIRPSWCMGAQACDRRRNGNGIGCQSGERNIYKYLISAFSGTHAKHDVRNRLQLSTGRIF